jgi:AbrB family looped-hinge helix DNA binding protein
MAQPQQADEYPARAVIRARGQITLPAQMRLQLGLRDGDDLLVTVEDGRIVLTPAALIPRDQAWYWAPQWQAGEREVDADLAAGRRGRVFDNDEEFLAALDASVDDPSTLR